MSNAITPLSTTVLAVCSSHSIAHAPKAGSVITSFHLNTICNMKNLIRKTSLLTILLLLANLFFVSESFGQATVTSDKPDYAPLSNAVFTGHGFAPNENVLLKVKNLKIAFS